jgi:O-antigen ligase/tetratricopeptide (TPR) repeat protein
MPDWRPTRRGWSNQRPQRAAAIDWPAALLRLADAALAGEIFVAPLLLGGRHDVGRFVFALLASTAAVAWFARQALTGQAARLPRAALVLFGGAAAMLVVQLAPLPASWLAALTPRTREVLPLWTGGSMAGTLGFWTTASLDPEATRLSLAMLAAYALLFLTAYARIQSRGDAVRLVKWIGISAGLMAVIGIVQFAVPNGRFLWIYDHPTRDAGAMLGGAFANRNHFAHFVALGVPALAAWLLLELQQSPGALPARPRTAQASSPRAKSACPGGERGERRWNAAVVAILLVASVVGVLLSCSRGGALALGVASAGAGIGLWRGGLLRGKQLAVLACAGVAAFLAVSFTGYERVMHRLDTLAEDTLDDVDAGGSRRRIWDANLEAIRAGGWLGSGAGTHAEIYPLYTFDPPGKHYSHAENGYLQIVTENGVPGGLLLAGALTMAAVVCWRALRRRAAHEAFAYSTACAAALAASAAHAVVDFVWYVPACLGSTLVLAACAWRLATAGEAADVPVAGKPAPAAREESRAALPWAAGLAMAALFAVMQLFPPARAASAWDAYLRMADAHRDFETRLAALPPEVAAGRLADAQSAELAAYESMIVELETVARLRPGFAAAHTMLANRLVQLFNVRQSLADNRLPLSQVRDAAVQSQFVSGAALHAWLARALGGNEALLYRAWNHARQAAALAPLEGDAYVRLAELCFLEGRGFAETDAYLQQATLVRPLDGPLLFEAGRQWGARGIDEWAQLCWARAARLPGTQRIHIARAVAGRLPAAAVIELFAPQWDALPDYWRAYRTTTPSEAGDLLAYASAAADRETPGLRPARAAAVWRSLAAMQRDVGQLDAAVASLGRACTAAPDDYASHRELALALCEAGQLAAAQAELRWCRDRRTNDRAIDAAAVSIARAQAAGPTPLTR